VETGLGRIGFPADSAIESILKVLKMPCYNVEGIFTHFSAADDPAENEHTSRQLDLFNRVLAELDTLGVNIPLKHCSGSAGLIAHPAANGNLVRPGIMLYGVNPCKANLIELKPTLSVRTRIEQVKEVAAGYRVGYGVGWRAPQNAVIATVSAGYGDGLLRSGSGKCVMLVKGKRAPQVGTICMDMSMLDITGINGVKPGDIATVIGDDSGEFISITDAARTAGTIPNEMLVSISKRVPRIYIQNGKMIEKSDYLENL
jgi:alanine racemase